MTKLLRLTINKIIKNYNEIDDIKVVSEIFIENMLEEIETAKTLVSLLEICSKPNVSKRLSIQFHKELISPNKKFFKTIEKANAALFQMHCFFTSTYMPGVMLRHNTDFSYLKVIEVINYNDGSTVLTCLKSPNGKKQIVIDSTEADFMFLNNI